LYRRYPVVSQASSRQAWADLAKLPSRLAGVPGEGARARLEKLTDAEAVRAKGLISLYLD
jgi:hypothetical protein